MGIKIRLTRMGTRKRPFYRIVAVDSRKKRDGAYLENLGVYHPLENEENEVQNIFKEQLGFKNFHFVNAEGIFLENLNVISVEEKF